MKFFVSIFSLMLLAACSAPVIDLKQPQIADGNNLQITSGTFSGGRFVSVENTDKKWVGGFAGGKEKWGDRKNLLRDISVKRMSSICGSSIYRVTLGPQYNMLDKDETMGGAAPVLGVAASMGAYLVAYSSTEDANIPTAIYTEFHCKWDDQ